MAKGGLEVHCRAQGFPWKLKPTPKEELDLGDEIFRAPHFELLDEVDEGSSCRHGREGARQCQNTMLFDDNGAHLACQQGVVHEGTSSSRLPNDFCTWCPRTSLVMTELKQGMYADKSDKTVKDLIWLFFGASDQTWGFKLQETAVCDGGGGAASSTMWKKMESRLGTRRGRGKLRARCGQCLREDQEDEDEEKVASPFKTDRIASDPYVIDLSWTFEMCHA